MRIVLGVLLATAVIGLAIYMYDRLADGGQDPVVLKYELRSVLVDDGRQGRFLYVGGKDLASSFSVVFPKAARDGYDGEGLTEMERRDLLKSSALSDKDLSSFSLSLVGREWSPEMIHGYSSCLGRLYHSEPPGKTVVFLTLQR